MARTSWTRTRGAPFAAPLMVTLGVVAAGLSATPAAAEDGLGARDTTIVGEQRILSASEVQQHDVTSTPDGTRVLGRVAADPDGGLTEPQRVYVFGDQELVAPTNTSFTVAEGLNAAGQTVYEFTVDAEPVPATLQVGYAIPGKAQWNYNVDGGFTETVGSWHRRVWWTITSVNNWRPCDTCTRHDYYRIHGKMRASALESAESWEGFKRAWIEFNRGNNGVSVSSFESDKPTDSIAGVPNQTTTVGFGASFDVSLGYGPVGAGGGVNASYGGSMTRSTENWHPVIRSEVGSGGVQWCRYQSEEFTGTKTVSTRVSYRTGRGVTNPPGWGIQTGQQDETGNCPTRA